MQTTASCYIIVLSKLLREKSGELKCRARPIEKYAEPVNIGLVTESQSLIREVYPKSTSMTNGLFAPGKDTVSRIQTDSVTEIAEDTQNGQKYYKIGGLL